MLFYSNITFTSINTKQLFFSDDTKWYQTSQSSPLHSFHALTHVLKAHWKVWLRLQVTPQARVIQLLGGNARKEMVRKWLSSQVKCHCACWTVLHFKWKEQWSRVYFIHKLEQELFMKSSCLILLSQVWSRERMSVRKWAFPTFHCSC